MVSKQDGNQALICAARNGHIDIVRQLLEHKADKLKKNDVRELFELDFLNICSPSYV
jgi:ankyrin repeat protein